jgi:hypothetical protein
VHVSTPFPEHWVAPGMHCPVHAPAEHNPPQATEAPHCPFVWHV